MNPIHPSTNPSHPAPPGVPSYQQLHDSLAVELEALLREDDEGLSPPSDEHEEQIACLTFALQSLCTIADFHDHGTRIHAESLHHDHHAR